ncbi:MAG: acyl carrier protein [Myxococcota bacterium]
MSKDELIERLIELAAKRFKAPKEELEGSSDFFDALAIDSFQAMELMTDVEEAFDVEVPDYELQGVRTFEALAVVLESRV